MRNMVFTSDDDSAYSFSEEVPLWSSIEPSTETSGLFHPNSHLFVAGDLNYRTHDSSPGPEAHKIYPQPTASSELPEHFSHLLKKDQLDRERKANRTLHGLVELPINFPPTYKYSVPKDTASQTRSVPGGDARWEWAIHRWPAWCDRILYLPSPSAALDLEPQIYTTLPVQHTSDHRPVALSLRIDDKSLPVDMEDIRSNPPFPVNPEWRTRGSAGRRREIIVGVLSYLALTKKGNAAILVVVGVALATIYLSSWLQR